MRWSDVDAAGIIFYGAYIRFFEMAETELFRAAGLTYRALYEEFDVWLPRVHLECDFKRPAQLDDMLEVSVWVGHLGKSSIRLNFEVSRAGETEPVAVASFTTVAVDRRSFAKVHLPEEMRVRLSAGLRPSGTSVDS